MFVHVRAKRRHDRRCYGIALTCHIVQHIGHVNHIVQHDHIGNEVLILDALLVLDRVTRFDDAIAPEKDPLGKAL